MPKTLEQITQMASTMDKKYIAIAGAHDAEVIKAALYADSLAVPIFIGVASEIKSSLSKLGRNSQDYQIIDVQTPEACAFEAVKLVRENKANILMKGCINTSVLMRAVINHDTGILTGHLLSHVMLYQVDSYPKLLACTDGGMNIAPSLEQKIQILKNAAIVFKALGYDKIYASCICGSEVLNPKVAAMTDARELSQMNEIWDKYDMSVIGPVGLDLAISKESCRHKLYSAEGAGEADILLVPTYEVGNAFGKALTYFAHAKSAGVVVGARCPIVLVSRSDDAMTKHMSIALGTLVSKAFDEENI